MDPSEGGKSISRPAAPRSKQPQVTRVECSWCKLGETPRAMTSDSRLVQSIPRHSMGLPYMPTLTPKTAPTDRHIWQSHGVSGIGFVQGRWGRLRFKGSTLSLTPQSLGFWSRKDRTSPKSVPAAAAKRHGFRRINTTKFGVLVFAFHLRTWCRTLSAFRNRHGQRCGFTTSHHQPTALKQVQVISNCRDLACTLKVPSIAFDVLLPTGFHSFA